MGPPARGDQFVWNGGTGDFTDPNNWTDATNPSKQSAPGPGDLAEYPGGATKFSGNTTAGANVTGQTTFNLAGNYSVTGGTLVNAPLALSNSGTLTTNFLTLSGGPTNVNAASLTVARQITAGADFSAFGGGTITAGDLLIGRGGNSNFMAFAGESLKTGAFGAEFIGLDSTGAVTIDGSGTTWSTQAPITVGLDSTGTLTIQNGAKVQSNTSNTPNASVIGGSIDASDTYHSAVGTLRVTGGSTWNEATGILVGVLGPGGTLTIDHGGVVTSPNGSIADASDHIRNTINPAAPGNVDIDGAGSAWITGTLFIGTTGTGTVFARENGTLNANSQISLGQTNLGRGSLVINTAATVTTADLTAGLAHGSNGAVFVDGAGSMLSASHSATIGREGDGFLTMSGAGRALTNDTTLGETAGGTGTVNLSDQGSTLHARALTIGHDGAGFVTVQTGATLQVDGDLTLGEDAGSNGSLILDGFSTKLIYGGGDVAIGSAGAATADVRNGFAADFSGVGVTLGEKEGGAGTLLVHGQSSSLSSAGLTIGGAGAGTLNLNTAASLFTHGDAALGDEPTGNGTATVDNAAWNIQGNLSVGGKGTGVLTVQNGATLAVHGGELAVGEEAAAKGTLNLTGKGTSLAFNGELNVGKSGNGVLTLKAGATATAGQLSVGKESTASGMLSIDGGGTSLTALDTTIGEKGTGTLSLTSGGLLITHGDGNLADQPGSSATASLDGASTWSVSGNVSVGGQGTAHLTIAGGSALLAAGKSVVIGDMGGAGTVLVTGADPATQTLSTLRYSGDLHVGDGRPGQLRLAAGGRVQLSTNGTGAVAVGVQANQTGSIAIDSPGSILQAATLALGGTLSTQGGTGTITLTNGSSAIVASAAKIWPGSSADVGGGRVTIGAVYPAANLGFVRLNPGGTLAGPGAIMGGVNNAGGLFLPSGAIPISGDFAQTGGALDLHLTAAGANDALSVGGAAMLGGTLELDFDQFVPSPGQTFRLLRSAAVTGSFAAVTVAGLRSGWNYSLTSDSQGLLLTSLGPAAATIPGDANGDGVVNFSDLLVLAQHYGQLATYSQGDFTGDGTVTFSDLLILAQHYGQSAASPTADPPFRPTTPVPEPAAILCFLGSMALRRRRPARLL